MAKTVKDVFSPNRSKQKEHQKRFAGIKDPDKRRDAERRYRAFYGKEVLGKVSNA